MARRCSFCGKDSPDDSAYCNYCSRPLEVDLICPKCGAKNPSYGVFCGSCGSDLPKVERPPAPPVPTMPPVTHPSRIEGQVLAPSACPHCGSRVSVYDFECPSCRRVLMGDDTESLAGGYDGPSESALTGTLLAAGVLLFLTGILAIAQGGLYLMASSIATQVDMPVGGVTCCGILSGIFGVAAVFGGYQCVTRGSWMFAMLGALLAMLSIAFLVGFVLGLIALILVAISKNEFSD